MATSIVLAQLNHPAEGNIGSVDFYVGDGISLWLWSQSGVDLTQSLITIQASLDTNKESYLAAAQGDVPIASGQAAFILQYAASHSVWRKIFSKAWFVLEDGIRTSNGTLAAYRTLLQAALDVITNELPAPFQTHINNERTAQSLTMATSVMSLVQCASFDNLLHIWINSRIAGSAMAINPSWNQV